MQSGGAGAAGLACLSLSKGSQGFSTSPSLVAWFGLPQLPRRRGAAGLRRDHGDVCGDDTRGNDSRGNDFGGNHTRVGGTPSLPGTRDPRAPDLSRGPRLFPRRRPMPELGARPRVGATPRRRELSGSEGGSPSHRPALPLPCRPTLLRAPKCKLKIPPLDGSLPKRPHK